MQTGATVQTCIRLVLSTASSTIERQLILQILKYVGPESRDGVRSRPPMTRSPEKAMMLGNGVLGNDGKKSPPNIRI